MRVVGRYILETHLIDNAMCLASQNTPSSGPTNNLKIRQGPYEPTAYKVIFEEARSLIHYGSC